MYKKRTVTSDFAMLDDLRFIWASQRRPALKFAAAFCGLLIWLPVSAVLAAIEIWNGRLFACLFIIACLAVAALLAWFVIALNLAMARIWRSGRTADPIN